MNLNSLINSNTAESGQLWIADKDVIVQKHGQRRGERELYYKVSQGEIIEFRFQSPANFRTKDNLYLSLDYAEFFSNFNLYGKILEDIRFGNKHSLDQILYAELFTKVGEASE